MTYHIVGLGDSANGWGNQVKQPCKTIGINDAERWGWTFDIICCFNSITKFSKEPIRLNAIINSKCPDGFYSHSTTWMQHFRTMRVTHHQAYNELVRKGRVYSSRTTPFVAMSIAYNLGASEIVFWGVDFITHSVYRPGNKYYDKEVNNYLKFIGKISDTCKVFRGADGSVFDKHLELYEHKKNV